MTAAARFWDRVTAVVPALPPSVLWGSAAVAALLVLSPTLWRGTPHALTIPHEGAHGGVALAAGPRLSRLPLHPDTPGVPLSARPPPRPRPVLPRAAGDTR